MGNIKKNGIDYSFSSSGGGGSYVLPPATTTILGGIKVGEGLNITRDGTLSCERISGDYLVKENPEGTGSFSMNRLPNSDIGNYSSTLGLYNTASGNYSTAEGYYTSVIDAQASHVEGAYNFINSGYYGIGIHSEGYGISGSNPIYAQISSIQQLSYGALIKFTNDDIIDNVDLYYCVYTEIEQNSTLIPAFFVVAYIDKENKEIGVQHLSYSTELLKEEMYVYIYPSISYAEGVGTHSEGIATMVSGYGSHSEGQGTIAQGNSQHVEGCYNEIDNDGKYLHIIGNSQDPQNRSNAHTVDWDGNAWYSGRVSANGGFDISSEDIENALGYTPSTNTVYEGSWSATSSSSVGDIVSSTIDFPKGKYMCIVTLPTTNIDTAAVQLYVNDNVINQYMRTTSYNNSVFIIDGENELNNVNVRSASTIVVNYSYLERGNIKLVKIG